MTGQVPERGVTAGGLVRPLVVFVAVTFTISWVLWVPLVWNPPGERLPWNFYAASAGPAVGAAVAAATCGPGLRVWARRSLSAQATGRAFLVVAASLAVYLTTAAIAMALTGEIGQWDQVGLTDKLPGFPVWAVLLVWVLTFGLGEELGWRGYLHPLLEQRWGFVAAATGVTVVWALWHLPAFFFNPTYTAMGWGVIGWVFALYAGSALLGWIARLGAWSVLPVVAWHGGFDLLTASDQTPAVIAAAVSTIVMIQGFTILAIIGFRQLRHRQPPP